RRRPSHGAARAARPRRPRREQRHRRDARRASAGAHARADRRRRARAQERARLSLIRALNASASPGHTPAPACDPEGGHVRKAQAMGAAHAHAGTRAAAQAPAGTRAAATELSLASVAGVGHGAGAHTAWAETKPPPGAHLGEAIALMRARGLRASAARRLVLEALLVADGPMSA